MFFVSSRRRHTRSLRDWSSDVCSSDLSIGRDGYVLLAIDRIRNRIRRDGAAGLKIPQRLSGPGIQGEEVAFVGQIGRASCRKSVDLGGRRISKKKKRRQKLDIQTLTDY